MVANHSEEGVLTQLKNPRHRGGAFEGVMVFGLFSLGGFVTALSWDAPGWARVAICLAAMAAGAYLGWRLSSWIEARRRRRRAEFEAEYRAEQQRETERKLAEARAAGTIRGKRP